MRGLERKSNGRRLQTSFLQPCFLGIRGFKSHLPHYKSSHWKVERAIIYGNFLVFFICKNIFILNFIGDKLNKMRYIILYSNK